MIKRDSTGQNAATSSREELYHMAADAVLLWPFLMMWACLDETTEDFRAAVIRN
jgi:hypothetical protein